VTLGSITDNLIRHTNIPVLVVKPPASFIGATPTETVTRIIVPLDAFRLAEQVLPEVTTLAIRLRATVSLVQVLTPVNYSQKEIMQPGLPWWDADIASAEAYLERASSYLTEEGVPVGREVLLAKDVATAILEYATRVNADLIAIATRGSGGMSRFVFGTVADEVTRKSPVSLVVFHPKLAAPTDRSSEISNTQALAGT